MKLSPRCPAGREFFFGISPRRQPVGGELFMVRSISRRASGEHDPPRPSSTVHGQCGRPRFAHRTKSSTRWMRWQSGHASYRRVLKAEDQDPAWPAWRCQRMEPPDHWFNTVLVERVAGKDYAKAWRNRTHRGKTNRSDSHRCQVRGAAQRLCPSEEKRCLIWAWPWPCLKRRRRPSQRHRWNLPAADRRRSAYPAIAGLASRWRDPASSAAGP